MRGERALRVFAPSLRKQIDLATGDEERVLSGCRLVSVFDISQTTGEPLPEPEMPSVRECDSAPYGSLLAFAQGRVIRVETIPTSPSKARGWWSFEDRTITIVSKCAQADRTRTLLHELAHAVDSENEATWARSQRQERELVAESAAYLAGKALGVNLSEASTFYVASWGADSETLVALADRTLAVARTLISGCDTAKEAAA